MFTTVEGAQAEMKQAIRVFALICIGVSIFIAGCGQREPQNLGSGQRGPQMFSSQQLYLIYAQTTETSDVQLVHMSATPTGMPLLGEEYEIPAAYRWGVILLGSDIASMVDDLNKYGVKEFLVSDNGGRLRREENAGGIVSVGQDDEPRIRDSDIAALSGLRTVERLSLLCPLVTDVQLKQVAGIESLKILCYTKGKGITEAGLDEIKKSHPNLLLKPSKGAIIDDLE